MRPFAALEAALMCAPSVVHAVAALAHFARERLAIAVHGQEAEVVGLPAIATLREDFVSIPPGIAAPSVVHPNPGDRVERRRLGDGDVTKWHEALSSRTGSEPVDFD